MILTLIRHGDCDTSGKYVGSGSDPSLSELGVKQINKVKSKLNFKEVFVSSLKRSKESGNLLTNMCREVEELNEIYFGDWEGLTFEEIQSKYNSEYILWMKSPFEYTPPNGECFLDFYSRLTNFVDEIRRENKDAVLIVHGGVIRVILIYLLELDIKKDFWKFKIDYASITTLEVISDFARVIKIDNSNI